MLNRFDHKFRELATRMSLEPDIVHIAALELGYALINRLLEEETEKPEAVRKLIMVKAHAALEQIQPGLVAEQLQKTENKEKEE